MRFIIIPGLDGSDDNHWQSRWESGWLPATTRIAPASWTHPDLGDWTAAIDRAVRRRPNDDVVLVAHSLGCLAAAHWLTTSSRTVRGAFLVAPPDHLTESFPTALIPTFASIDHAPLGLPAVLIASSNDPYCTVEAADRLATTWAVPLVITGHHGHLNSDSDLGMWPLGRQLFISFLAGLGFSVEDRT
jgi:predicted alpha/beta hydrolase family esterase